VPSPADAAQYSTRRDQKHRGNTGRGATGAVRSGVSAGRGGEIGASEAVAAVLASNLPGPDALDRQDITVHRNQFRWAMVPASPAATVGRLLRSGQPGGDACVN